MREIEEEMANYVSLLKKDYLKEIRDEACTITACEFKKLGITHVWYRRASSV